MEKEELLRRSPLRIFDDSIKGGLGKGNIGVITSKPGVGKTGCLVHFAIDKMLQGKHVLHISFARRPDAVLNWYEDIYEEISKKRDLEDSKRIYNEAIKNRIVLSFHQDTMKINHILSAIVNITNGGHFTPDIVLFNGLDAAKLSDDDLKSIHSFAKTCDFEVWFAVNIQEWDECGVARKIKAVLDKIDVLIDIRNEGDYIHLECAKDHDNKELKDMHLKLDPNTFLIAEAE